MHFEQVSLCCAAEQPETEGGGIPVTADEMSELMYKPLPGEWGERSRDEECERIITGINQLITVGLYAETDVNIRVSTGSAPSYTHPPPPLCFCYRDHCSLFRSRGLNPVSHLLHCDRLSHWPGHHQTATPQQILQVSSTIPPSSLLPANVSTCE